MDFDPTPILDTSLLELGCKGALVAISKNGTTRTFSAGIISKSEHHRPYYIYSISKTFTAVAVMRLCENQGDFLDETFFSIFPGTSIPRNITVRQLLNHTSGLSDYFLSSEYQNAVSSHPAEPWTYEEIMTAGLKNTPLFAPGEGWAYSNPAYGLLKELIEKKSGMDYYTYLQEKILNKIDLRDTRAFLKQDVDLTLLEGEDTSISGDFRPQYSPGWIVTGCLISTVSDIAKFYYALFSGSIITDESIHKMTQTVDVLSSSPPDAIPAYGLGLMHFRNAPLGKAYGHGGGGPGYTTYAMHYPNLKGSSFTISLVLNKTLAATPFGLADKITRAYLGLNADRK
jgi:D-alanyl-D-alanine carboxypeptidase